MTPGILANTIRALFPARLAPLASGTMSLVFFPEKIYTPCTSGRCGCIVLRINTLSNMRTAGLSWAETDRETSVNVEKKQIRVIFSKNYIFECPAGRLLKRNTAKNRGVF